MFDYPVVCNNYFLVICLAVSLSYICVLHTLSFSLSPSPSACLSAPSVCACQTCPCPGAKDHDATVFKLEYSLPPDVTDGHFGTEK